jgi:hypothetical protein
MTVRADELLVSTLPTVAALRANAAAVREYGGPNLLGICIFRLPTREDETTLTIGEVAAALEKCRPDFDVEIKAEVGETGSKALSLVVSNNGTLSARPGEGALTLDIFSGGQGLRVRETVEFDSVMPICGGLKREVVRCGPRRSNGVRLMRVSSRPGDIGKVVLESSGERLQFLETVIWAVLEDGRPWSKTHRIELDSL